MVFSYECFELGLLTITQFSTFKNVEVIYNYTFICLLIFCQLLT